MAEKYSKYRNESNTRLLAGLFIETKSFLQTVPPVYTLRDWDHVTNAGVPVQSLYLLYMAMEDLTEYQFANAYLDGWEHWQRLCESPFFKPYVARWREELQLKIKAEALQRMKEAAKDPGHKSYVEINKYLTNEAWKTPDKKGRPKKADIAKAAKEAVHASLTVQDDYERILGAPEGEIKLNG